MFIYCKTALELISSHWLVIVNQNGVSGNLYMTFLLLVMYVTVISQVIESPTY